MPKREKVVKKITLHFVFMKLYYTYCFLYEVNYEL